MKRLILVAMYLVFCFPVWTQTIQEQDTIRVDSTYKKSHEASLVIDRSTHQIWSTSSDMINSYYLTDDIAVKIMKTKIIGGITLKTLSIILGVLIIVICIIVIGLYFLYSKLSKRIEENKNETYKMMKCVKRTEDCVKDLSNKVDKVYKKVKEDTNTEVKEVISKIKNEVVFESVESVPIRNTSEEINLNDILGYGEYLGNLEMRLSNFRTSETIYIIKKDNNKSDIYFVVDSFNVQKAIKNKTVCLDPLCNVVKGNQHTAIDVLTLEPGILQLEHDNIYKMIEKASIELIS